jgi:predicted DNA binding CopG/RHH family protein
MATKEKNIQLDEFEREALEAFERGVLRPIGTKASLAKFKAAAKATSAKDKRINIRLSSPDLQGLQVRALEEGLPYQTLIASVLHKYVSGRLIDSGSRALVSGSAVGKKRGNP